MGVVTELQHTSARHWQHSRSPQCAQKESGSRVSRPQCPSVRHRLTLSLGHVWNDHLNSSLPTKIFVDTSHKISTHFGCDPNSPSSAQHPQTPQHQPYFNLSRTENIVSCTRKACPVIAPSSAVMWESLRTSESSCRRWLTFRCARFIVHKLVADEA